MKKGEAEIRYGEAEMKKGKAEIGYGEAEMKNGKAEIRYGEAEMKNGKAEIGYGEAEMKKGKAEIRYGKAEMKKGEAEMLKMKHLVEFGWCEAHDMRVEVGMDDPSTALRERGAVVGETEVRSEKAEMGFQYWNHLTQLLAKLAGSVAILPNSIDTATCQLAFKPKPDLFLSYHKGIISTRCIQRLHCACPNFEIHCFTARWKL